MFDFVIRQKKFLAAFFCSQIVYLVASYFCYFPVGLFTGEWNISAHLGTQAYMLSVSDIRTVNGQLANIYDVPVPGEKSVANVLSLGPIELIATPAVDPVYCMRIGGFRIPLLKKTYKGAFEYYYTAVFSVLPFDRTLLLHTLSILLGSVIIFLVAYIVLNLLGLLSSIVVMFLLATNLLYVFWHLNPSFGDSFMEICSLLIFLIGMRLLRSARKQYFYWLSFLVGFGIYQKITIVWILVPLVFLASVFNYKLLVRQSFRSVLASVNWFWCAVLFIFNFFPLILYKWQVANTEMLAVNVAKNLLDVQKVVGALSFWFVICFRMFCFPLDFLMGFSGVNVIQSHYIYAALVIVLFLLPLGFYVICPKIVTRKRDIVFLYLLFGGMISCLAIFNREGFGYGHPHFLLPYMFAICAITLLLFGELVSQRMSRNKYHCMKELVVLLGACLICFVQLGQVREYAQSFNQESHQIHLVETHKEVAQYLESHRIDTLIVTSYNLLGIIEFLTHNHILPLNYWRMIKDASNLKMPLRKMLSLNKGNYYLYKVGYNLDTSNIFAEPPMTILEEVALQNGLNLLPIKTFYFGNKPMYVLYKIK